MLTKEARFVDKVHYSVQTVHHQTVYDCLNRHCEFQVSAIVFGVPWTQMTVTVTGSDIKKQSKYHQSLSELFVKNSFVRKHNLECKRHGTWWGMRPSVLVFFVSSPSLFRSHMYSRLGDTRMDGWQCVKYKRDFSTQSKHSAWNLAVIAELCRCTTH